jgi:hypothetical protein
VMRTPGCRAPAGSFRRLWLGGVALALAGTALAGCSHLRWPWTHRPPPPPPAVHELVETSPDGRASLDFPQYWKRNTLVVDLQGISGSGGLVLRPRLGATWPVRLAVRVRPGSMGQLEIRADQRVVIPITTQGAKPVDLELAPGVYTPKTDEIRVSWGPGYSPGD